MLYIFAGSSNSQDSFPAAGSSGASMDGYGGYQGGYPGAGSGGPTADYTPPPPRPPSQSSAPQSHQGMHYYIIYTYCSFLQPIEYFVHFKLFSLFRNATRQLPERNVSELWARTVYTTAGSRNGTANGI